jgi:hypothetical protein
MTHTRRPRASDNKRKAMPLLILFLLFCAPTVGAIDVTQFEELVGYTIADCTHVSGELEGVDFDKLVKLDNGMIFEFHDYSYLESRGRVSSLRPAGSPSPSGARTQLLQALDFACKPFRL